MSQSDFPASPPSHALADVAELRAELDLRNQLVEQLSQELFRIVKDGDRVLPPSGMESSSALQEQSEQLHQLRGELADIEQQVRFYQEQISTRDAELYRLQQSVQALSDRNHMLEQVVQELPQIYRQKFSERIEPVRDKVERLQRENRQLYAELQSVSYRLAMRTRNGAQPLDLSQPQREAEPYPKFENV
ncbi:hypothetical protein KR51_00021550 [Rubidibacter lacunae KORDI 51-2]|uniref:Basic region leucine zipper n=1 Tax=Rubidibacter lacunae KORDI 51-2 TaxID=582515 RepID=U5DNI1_9CHRO|nr:Npun_F5560 family protein [Rubidibacter lacunae]ERN41265.1 hypothetical protein KR51_00021550 [Rubidibacter lacunae KORDI 51-2]